MQLAQNGRNCWCAVSTTNTNVSWTWNGSSSSCCCYSCCCFCSYGSNNERQQCPVNAAREMSTLWTRFSLQKAAVNVSVCDSLYEWVCVCISKKATGKLQQLLSAHANCQCTERNYCELSDKRTRCMQNVTTLQENTVELIIKDRDTYKIHIHCKKLVWTE